MWTLTGPFDGEVVGELSFQKTKLLKTGTSYPLGRKGTPLIVASKKVSGSHCDFFVGKYSVDDLGDPTKIPTLEFVNRRDKGMRIMRGETQIDVNPSATHELQDGDVVTIVSGGSIIVQWVAVCCYAQPVRGKLPVSLDACASLGINVVPIPNPHVTHHLVSTYIVNPAIAVSLLSACQLVKPEWINEVVRLGSLSADSSGGASLEHTFSLPPISKFRPSFSPSLLPEQKVFKVWEPNEERLDMLASYRFLCVGEKGRELESDLRDMIERGGAAFETFDVKAGKTKFHRALTRGQAKEGKRQIVLAKGQGMQAAIGKGGWQELVEEARTFGVHCIEPEVLVQAVVSLDTSLLVLEPITAMDVDEGPSSSSTIPDFIPNMHPDEPSIAPPETEQPLKGFGRQVAPLRASQEPTSVPKSPPKSPQLEEPVEISRPRRALTRRVNAGVPVVTGLDDPSSILDTTPDVSAPPSPPPAIVDLTASTPARPTRLKRRVLTDAAPETLGSDVFALRIDEPSEQPPLKKFKALFDASDPHRTGASAFDGNAVEEIHSATLDSSSQTQTQSQVADKAGRPLRSGVYVNLDVLREEEEESQSGAGLVSDQRRAKRSIEDVDEDGEMGDVESATLTSGAESAPSKAKKRAVENVNAVEKTSDKTKKPASTHAAGKPPSTTNIAKTVKGGALPGQPDKDTAFLKAIASTKRGKKAEDDFDREFNKLKISKPDLVREEPEKEWAVLEDFGDETNVRGNFMVVVELDVFNNGERMRKTRDVAPGWQGKPNFKKFKKKEGYTRGSKIELVASEENDYGMGPSYWKSGNAQNQSQVDSAPTKKRTEVKGESPKRIAPKRRNQALVINDSDDSDETVALRKGRSRAPSRADSLAPGVAKRTTRSTKASGPTNPLFLHFDDEDAIHEEAEPQLATSDNDTQTLMSSAGTAKVTRAKGPPKAKKPAPILADDDSDDGVFKGFRSKRQR